MENIIKLIKKVQSCNICEPFLPHGIRPVIQISSHAKILVVGQAPGRKVHETGIPFNDPSGDRLREWMSVSKETFYDANKIAILPMGFCYPGTGKSGDLPPRRECAETWREKLLAQLPQVELTLVIGKYAQDYHLVRNLISHQGKKHSLTENVKHWKTYWPNIVPLPHPSPRNNIWLKKNEWFKEILPVLQKRIDELL